MLEATKEAGGNVEEVAKVAVTVAIDGVAVIGNTAVKAVQDMPFGVLKGAKEVAVSALPKAKAA